MAFETGQMVGFMQVAYRNGTLDRFMRIFGKSVYGLMDENGTSFDVLIHRLDEGGAAAIANFERLLSRSGPLMKLVSRDWVMRAASRMLDVKAFAGLLSLAIEMTLAVYLAKNEGRERPVSDTLKRYLRKLGRNRGVVKEPDPFATPGRDVM
ncbi:MAG: hypothetical protein KKF41_05080 [Actinobacteria bacterium]|nr:hypothetical protein [Actinomycetota bacterium]MBU1943972.1 hypothetical protein [Actinomycetota bacterium]MBU2686940.1 hypothetical protein [Actinomycetota bacterium]